METNQAIQDILETVTFIKDNAVTKEEFESRLGGVETRLGGVETRLGGVETRLGGVEQRLTKIEATMVTKDYLDDKLIDFKGDLMVLMRKEDRKVAELIGMLQKKNVLSDEEAKRILTMEPFPQII